MQKSPRSYLFVGTLIAGGFVIGFLVGQSNSPATFPLGTTVSAQLPTSANLSPVWKAWQILDENFVAKSASSTPITEQDKVYGLIEGLAKSYDDPYTVFMPPQEATAFDQEISGSFGGLGMEIGSRDNLITVIAPLKGTPADKAGILTGDIIVEIDGKSTQDMSVDEAVREIRGEVGTAVKLKLARKDSQEFIEKSVVRDVIKIPTTKATLRQDGIFDIEVYNFGATAASEFRQALRQFMQSGSKKLIIDLRGNPGGYLEAAVDMASWFLPMGSVVVQEDFGGKQEPTVHRSKGYNVYRSDWKVVLLVNEGSASASEILAGALQEHERAVLIGNTTFGKGSVQELIKLTPDTSLKVTVARWLTPNGRSISQNGLTPDFRVDRSADDLTADKDPQLDAAVDYLNGKEVHVTADLPTTATSTKEQ